MMVEITPQIPSSALGRIPIPKIPCFYGTLIHKWEIKTIVEFCPFSIGTKVSFAEVISVSIVDNIVSTNWNSYLKNSSSPSVVVSSIQYSEGGVLDSDRVLRSLDSLSRGNTNKRKRLVARLVSFERITVIAGEPAGPVGLVAGPDVGLECEALLDRLEAELVHVGNSTISNCVGEARQQEHAYCPLHSPHYINYYASQKITADLSSFVTPTPQTRTASPLSPLQPSCLRLPYTPLTTLFNSPSSSASQKANLLLCICRQQIMLNRRLRKIEEEDLLKLKRNQKINQKKGRCYADSYNQCNQIQSLIIPSGKILMGQQLIACDSGAGIHYNHLTQELKLDFIHKFK